MLAGTIISRLLKKIHMKTFFTATLGCKINQYETRALAEAWERSGLVRVDDPARAGTLLVNSCAVTANAVSDLRQLVRRLHRDNPGAAIVVTGCAAEVLAEELAALPGVVRVVPQSRKAELLEQAPSRPGWQPFAVSGYDRARAVLKVQDGCSHRCTYCIVPLTRGPSVSRPPAEVLAEARRLLEAGFREIVVGGVNLRQFGRDLPGAPDFWDLLALLERELAPQWAGRARLRISSLEPGQLGDKALQTLAASRLVCPHLHLSLQSGDPGVLKLMGRGHYRPEQALEFCRHLTAFWPVFGLGADLLVGFPGEDEAAFANTLDLCRKLPLSYAHVFPYSSRPGTVAAGRADQNAPEVRKSRAARLRAVVSGKKRAFVRAQAERDRLSVVLEDAAGQGLSEHYTACTVLGAGSLPPRTLVAARPEGLDKGRILARFLEVLE